MDLIETELDDGVIFKIQKGFSYIQQNEFMQIIERFVHLGKLRELQESLKEKERELTIEDFTNVLKNGSALTFNFELSKYLLTHLVKEPEITEEMLNDPDDPNTENFYVLGIKLIELAMPYITKLMNLKKTPTL